MVGWSFGGRRAEVRRAIDETASAVCCSGASLAHSFLVRLRVPRPQAVAIATDNAYLYSLDTAGQLWRNNGNDPKPFLLHTLPGASHPVSFGAGYCLLTPSGATLCAGDHRQGALGDGSAWTPIPTPVQAPY